jgi:hypothetical protein
LAGHGLLPHARVSGLRSKRSASTPPSPWQRSLAGLS